MQSIPNAFTQWVADNVDHYVMTLDGLGSLHGMGIIAISTSSSATSSSSTTLLLQALQKL